MTVGDANPLLIQLLPGVEAAALPGRGATSRCKPPTSPA